MDRDWKTVRILVEVPVKGLSEKDTRWIVEQALTSSTTFDDFVRRYRQGPVGRIKVKSYQRVASSGALNREARP